MEFLQEITNYLNQLFVIRKYLGKPLSYATEEDIFMLIEKLETMDYSESTKKICSRGYPPSYRILQSYFQPPSFCGSLFNHFLNQGSEIKSFRKQEIDKRLSHRER